MKKIMIVNTSTDYFEGSSKATGLWLGELVHFYDYFNSKNYQIDLFNTDGVSTPIDPVSLKPLMLDNMTKKYYNNQSFMDILSNSQSINEAKPTEYDVIYFTGGHGVMFDFPNNEAVQHAINEVYNHGGIVAAVCHGIAALLNVKDENGRYFIDNKEITGFSNTEEILANRKKIVPFMLESEIKNVKRIIVKPKYHLFPMLKSTIDWLPDKIPNHQNKLHKLLIIYLIKIKLSKFCSAF